jgi:cytoskeletal protein RodZ
LTRERIAERTRISVSSIEALEKGDFASLPTGAFLDDIVRDYALTVGIDPEPMVEQAQVERKAVAAKWNVALGDLNDFLQTELGGVPRPPTDRSFQQSRREPITVSPLVRRGSFLDVDPAPELPLAADRELRSGGTLFGRNPYEVPARRPHRFLLTTFALLALGGWGAYVYELTGLPNRETIDALAGVAKPANTEDHTASSVERVDSTGHESQPEVKQESRGTAGTETPQVDSGVASAPAPPVPLIERSAPATQPVAPEAAEAVPPAQDISGSWSLTTHVESSSRPDASSGASLGYVIDFQQTGSRVIGKGRKVSENGAAIAAGAQTSIAAVGMMAGDRLTLTFTEQGADRASQGKLVLLADDGGLRGRFSSAQSSGTVDARRQRP